MVEKIHVKTVEDAVPRRHLVKCLETNSNVPVENYILENSAKRKIKKKKRKLKRNSKNDEKTVSLTTVV